MPYANVLSFIFRFLHDHGGPYHDGDDVFHDAYDSLSSSIFHQFPFYLSSVFLQEPLAGFVTLFQSWSLHK